MLVNKVSYPNVSFGKELMYKGRYIPHKQDQTHDIIRADFEDKMGSYIFYYHQLQAEEAEKYKKFVGAHPKEGNFPPKASSIKYHQMKNTNEATVNKNVLNALDIYAFRERVPNKLYSGAQLDKEPETLSRLKDSGIKTVFALAGNEDYQEEVEKAGMKYAELRKIKDSGLSIFDIKGDILKDLIKNPEMWAEEPKTGKLAGLKAFVRTLKGENPELPLPLYFGCQYGTDRTFMWYELFKILEKADMDKPLPPEIVEKVAQSVVEAEDHFRW